ncbi:glycosyltransferase [Ectobacillus sp. sgz5001026]|uniref:glycosyltransferase n=1 Tax=Ectobacillus sp. sgz5001026 TaxID=3242473 RepID=UPI0036D3F2C3
MKVLHVNAGAETGGGKTHILSLLSQLPMNEVELAVFEEGEISKEARELGITVHVFKQASRYDLSVLRRLTAFINDNQYDIVHTHGARANFFVALLKSRIHAKWVTTIHSDPLLDFMKRGFKGWLFTKLNLRALKKVDLFFAITERFKKNLVSLGLPAGKIKVIYNGIYYTQEPATPYDKQEDLHIPADSFTVIQVARLHPVKGHEILLDALQKVNIPNLKVLLVGDGPSEQQLKDIVKERELTDTVLFLGFRRDTDRLYATANISLLTSYSESFPLVLLESANQRVPFIATDVGDMHKLLPNSSYGWVIKAGDSDALAAALEEAYLTRHELAVMGEHMYQYASSRFSLEKLSRDTYESYESLLR